MSYIRNTSLTIMILIIALLSACTTSTPAPTPSANDLRATANAMDPAAPVATPAASNTLMGSGPYKYTTMEKFGYNWPYKPQPGNPTPKIRDNAVSSGKGITTTHDIGVHSGELAVIKGVTITVGKGGTTLGTPCALAILTPGYYKNITGTEWRFEVYYLPEVSPLDPTGWSRVLTEQAITVESDIYGCPKLGAKSNERGLKDIQVFFSNENAPFGQ